MAEQYSGVTWTTAELLTEVRAEARVPDNAATDAEILREATWAIWSELHSPLLTDIGRSAYDIRTLDLLDSGALGRDGDEYVLPSHCTAESISHVVHYDTLTSDNPSKLPNLPLQNREDYSDGSSTGTPAYWSFKSGRLLVTPAPASTSTGYLRVFYQRRHPELVVITNNVVDVHEILTAANTVEMASTPTGWPASFPYSIDIYSIYGPHRFYVTDLSIASESSSVFTYTAPVDEQPIADTPAIAENPTAVATLSGQSSHVHLPPEFRKPLNLRVASYLLRQIGDEARANSMLGEYRAMLQSIQNSLQPRAKNSSQRIINPNSPLRGQGYRRRYR